MLVPFIQHQDTNYRVHHHKTSYESLYSKFTLPNLTNPDTPNHRRNTNIHRLNPAFLICFFSLLLISMTSPLFFTSLLLFSRLRSLFWFSGFLVAFPHRFIPCSLSSSRVSLAGYPQYPGALCIPPTVSHFSLAQDILSCIP